MQNLTKKALTTITRRNVIELFLKSLPYLRSGWCFTGLSLVKFFATLATTINTNVESPGYLSVSRDGFKQWFVGFSDGEACFFINKQTFSKSTKVRFTFVYQLRATH